MQNEAPAGDISAEEADMAKGKFKPSETVIKRQDVYKYPYAGLEFTLPEALLKKWTARPSRCFGMKAPMRRAT